ncbi:DUF5134 domain-containing protein [Streptomyces sp. NPDC093984]|uniref:DUF5134 domain-containing protein n=1 Tax=Streptomyces sp. NPDC093984 TaxID=3366052 RepID=UPI003827C371
MGTPVGLVHCMLTLLFVVVLVHGWAQDVRAPKLALRSRVDQLLHAVMALSMAAMPWVTIHAVAGGLLSGVFTVAALWFLLPADRRAGNRAAAVVHRLPRAAGMAAMAWMLRTPHTGTAHDHLHGALPASGPILLNGQEAGHLPSGSAITLSLASYLLACALWSLTRPMPTLRSAVSTARRAAAATPLRHIDDGAMALGTAVMLVLPH